MAELSPGSVLAGCRVEAVLGRGGMGVVYLATQLSLDRPVAVKVVAPELAGDATFRERFKRESRIAASIEHPNVIPVYEAGEGEGVLYLIMRYVEGTDLRALIDAEGALDPVRAAGIVRQVAAALAAAHRRDLIHRDVKPANVLIDSGGDSEHAYLTDFGIARHAAATALTHTGSVIGTLDYLAPERIEGSSADGRADVYALGCVLYESLTGTRPYERDNDMAKMYAHLNAPVPSTRELEPTVPGELDELAQRAMAKNPDDRFATAGQFAEALADAVPTRTSRTPAAEAPPEADAGSPETVTAATRAAAGSETAIGAEAATGTETATGAEAGTAATRAAPAARESTSSLPPSGGGRTAPRRRAGLLAAGAAGVAAVAVVLALALSGGDAGDDGAPPPDKLAFRLAGEVRLQPGPDGMAVDSGLLWVTNKRTGKVVPVEEGSRAVSEPITVGPNPDSVAVGLGSVWVTNTGSDNVSRIDPDSKTVVDTIDVGDGPEGIAVSKDAVWVANGLDGTVSRISSDGEVTTKPVGQGPVQIAVTGDDRIWVTLSKANEVAELDRESGEPIGERASVPGQPRGIAFDGERLWVAATTGGYLGVFSPDRPGDVTQVGGIRGPREVRFGLGAIWVTTGSNQRLVAVDPATTNGVDTFQVGPLTYGLAVSDSAAWAASEDTGRVVKVVPRR